MHSCHFKGAFRVKIVMSGFMAYFLGIVVVRERSPSLRSAEQGSSRIFCRGAARA